MTTNTGVNIRDYFPPEIYEAVENYVKNPSEVTARPLNQSPNAELVNKVAEFILRSGRASPEHFKHLKNVTAIEVADLSTKMNIEVVQEIFKQYHGSLKQVGLPPLATKAPLEIPELDQEVDSVHLPGSLTLEQAEAILVSASCGGKRRIASVKVESLEHLELISKQRLNIENLSVDLSNYNTINDEMLKKIARDHGSSLKELNVSANSPITDAGLKPFASLAPKLEVLSIPGCVNVTLVGCEFPSLKKLDVQSTSVSNEALKNFKNLTALNISNCRINLSGCEFPDLKQLIASYSEINDSAMQTLSRTSSGLTELDVGNCSVTLTGCQFKNLVKLNAQWTTVTDDVLKEFTNLRELHINGCVNVRLTGCNFSLEVLVASGPKTPSGGGVNDTTLARFTRLRELTIESSRWIALNGCVFHNLEKLCLKSLVDPMGEGNLSKNIQRISQSSPYLRHLELSNISNVDLVGCKFPALETFIATQVPGLSEQAMQDISRNSKGLKVLKVNGMAGLRFRGCELPSLVVLDVLSTRMDDQALSHIVETSPHLNDVNVSCCKEVTFQGYVIRNLDKLNVHNTSVSDETLQPTLDASPDMRELDVSRNDNVTLRGFNLKNLIKLNMQEIGKGSSMDKGTLVKISKTAPQLRFLNASYIVVDWAGVELPKIQELIIEEYVISKQLCLTDAAIDDISRTSPLLRKLHLANSQVTLANSEFTSLDELQVRECPISSETYSRLKEKRPRLRINTH